jgi:hypothetical protein
MMVAVAAAAVVVFADIRNVTRCTFPLFSLLAAWCYLHRFHFSVYFLNNRPNQNLHRRAYLEDFENQLYNARCLYCERIKLTID